MRYELFLRREAGVDDEVLEATRQRAGETLSVEPFAGEADAGARGVDLGVEADARGAAEALCAAAFDLAEAYGLTVFDPQLGRTVSRSDSEQIGEQVARTNAFATAALGSLESSPRVGSRAAAKGWLILAGAIVALIVAIKLLRCAAL
jgi:hypothetical protein